MIRPFLEWLETTPWSIALLESLYVWPLLESTHVLSLMLFVGTTAMMDLRLLGISFRSVPASEFTKRMLPWTRVGFAIMVITGVVLFYASPVRYYHNLFFRIKFFLLLLAGGNVWYFHSRVHTRIGDWDRAIAPPACGEDRRRGFALLMGGGDHHRASDRVQLVRLRHPAAARLRELGSGMRRSSGGR